MKFFDTHCDTVQKVLNGKLNFLTGEGEGHVSLPGMLKASVCTQIFAAFVLSEYYPGKERARAEEMIAGIKQLAKDSAGQIQIVHTASELEVYCPDGPIGAIIGLEGADPLEGKAENLQDFYALGVRDIIPAWKDNPFSGTAFGTNAPLTEEGIKLVELAEELHVMVDVSHLSDAAFDSVLEVTKQPFIASHSNCRALCPTLRNLTDSQIRALADRGGVMGINFSPAFLDPEFYEKSLPLWEQFSSLDSTPEEKEQLHEEMRKIPRPSMEWIARHVKHAIDVGGEDVIGIGGDLDGISTTPVGIDGIADYVKIPELLFNAGLKTRQVEKVCYRNFLRVFKEVLSGSNQD